MEGYRHVLFLFHLAILGPSLVHLYFAASRLNRPCSTVLYSRPIMPLPWHSQSRSPGLAE